MEKDLRYIPLFEIYQGLLTEKQRKIFSDYYLFDLSLGEIAGEEGLTRQSVFDVVKKVKNKLDEFEEKLKIHQKNGEVLSEIEKKEDKETFDKIKEKMSEKLELARAGNMSITHRFPKLSFRGGRWYNDY